MDRAPMFSSVKKPPTGWLVLLSLFVLFISACGGSTDTTTTTAAKPTPASAPTATPTAAVSLTTFNGKGFSIDYPNDWIKQDQNQTQNGIEVEQVQFIRLAQHLDTALAQDIINPGGLTSAQYEDVMASVVKGNLLKNVQTIDMPTTVEMNGKTWEQRGYTGDLSSNGSAIHIKAVTLAYANPDNNKIYGLFLGAEPNLYDEANTQYFKPMLDSFKMK